MINSTEIGVDLGRHEIKIALVKEINSGKGQKINNLVDFESYPVKNSPYSPKYFDEVREAIRSFSKKIKKSSLSINFSIPYSEEFSKIAIFEMPMVEEKDLAMGIKFEAEQIFYDKEPNSYVSTWRTNRKYEELNELEVLYATLSSEIVKSLSKFKTITWRVKKVVLQPLLLERFAKKNDVIVDFGYENTRVYMYKDGILSTINIVPIGAKKIEEELTKLINKKNDEIIGISDKIEASTKFTEEDEENLELPPIDEPESNLEEETEKGYISDIEGEVKRLIHNIYVMNDYVEPEQEFLEASLAVDDLLTSLIEEVKRNIRAFEVNNTIMLDNIYYTGRISQIKFLNVKLKAELDFEVEELNIVSKEIEDTSYEIASLVALSQREKDKMEFSQYIRANIDYSSILVGALALSMTSILVMNMIHNNYDKTIEKQQIAIAEQQETIQKVDSNISMVQSSLSTSQSVIDKINALTADSTYVSDFLYLMPTLIPKTIVVSSIDTDGTTVKLSGLSSDYSSIGFFANKLNKHGSAKISSIEEYGEENDTTYSVVAKNPENTGDKYIATKKFQIEYQFNAPTTR